MSPTKDGKQATIRGCLHALKSEVGQLQTVLRMNMTENKATHQKFDKVIDQLTENLAAFREGLDTKIQANALKVADIKGQLRSTWYVTGFVTLLMVIVGAVLRFGQ